MIIYEASLKYSVKGSTGAQRNLKNSEDVRNYLQNAVHENPMQERFFVIALNRKNRPLGYMPVTTGTASSSLVHPREVFRFAIMEGASAVIVAHNHPSGDPCPSSADMQVTRLLREASRAVDIDLLDHVIIGQADPDGENSYQKQGYYSFRDAGIL